MTMRNKFVTTKQIINTMNVCVSTMMEEPRQFVVVGAATAVNVAVFGLKNE